MADPIDDILAVIDRLSPSEVMQLEGAALERQLGDIHAAIMAASGVIAELDREIRQHEATESHLHYQKALSDKEMLESHVKRLQRAASQLQSMIRSMSL